MVIFKADHTHFSTAMCMMNTFRKDSSLCDIKLIIDKKNLHAHRAVLAAGSPYFNSLFLGQFSEANMQEVNLSEVTRSITALERILNFIYTGEIDIDEVNLGIITKLSSFFLIENLKEFCCTFMENNLSLPTCLRFYLYSIGHDQAEIEKASWPMVQSRFHDHLIYTEDTLEISTSEMQFLFEKDVLLHCSNVSILRFIAMWVIKGLTEGHVMIANVIFNYVIERDNAPQVGSVPLSKELSGDSLYQMVESSLNDSVLEGKDLFLNTFKEVLCKLTTENEIHTIETRSEARNKSKEMAIIAVFPSNDVMKHKKKIIASKYAMKFDTLVTDRPILHLCAYIPRTRCWYSLRKIYKNDSTFALLINEEAESHRFVALHDELLLINDNSEEITVKNLKNLSNQEIKSSTIYDFVESESKALVSLSDQEEVVIDFRLTTGKNDSVYLVSLFRRFENSDLKRLSGIYFNGYRQYNGNTWRKIFQTNVTAHVPNDYDEYGSLELSDMYATISTVSNEMMIVHSDNQLCIVLVADLNQENAKQVIVSSFPLVRDNNMDIGNQTKIVETNDAMYIVTDVITYPDMVDGKVMVRFEYRLNSKHLREISSTEVSVSQFAEYSEYFDLYPCLCANSASLGDGLWYMEGDKDGASFLTKVTVDDNKTPVIEHHTPPPFNGITAMLASRISSQILENKEPIARFLGNE